MSESDITLATYVARYNYHNSFDCLETCIVILGRGLIPPKKVNRWEVTSTARKFGLQISKTDIKVHQKKFALSCAKANGNDVRNVIGIIRAQCRGNISALSVQIARECQKVFRDAPLKTQHATYSGWIGSLIECIILALSHQFDPSSPTLSLVDAIVDSIHTLMRKSKGKFTSQLVKTFVELASAPFPEDKSLLQISLLQAMSSIDLSKSYLSRHMIPRHFCVCLQEVLHRLLNITHVYVTTHDVKELRSVRSVLLASIMCFDHKELLDEFNSMSW